MRDAEHIYLIEEFKMKIRALLASVGAALALGLASPAWALYVISVDAPTTGVQGSTVTVNVNLSMDDALDNVDSIMFSLLYKPAVLSYLGGTVGSLIPDPPWITSIADSPTGSINLSALFDPFSPVFDPLDSSFDATIDPFGASGVLLNGTVAQFTFRLIGAGAGDLTLSDVLLDNFVTFPAGFQPDTISNASIDVQANNQVPVPGTVLLLGLGLMALGWTRRHTAANH